MDTQLERFLGGKKRVVFVLGVYSKDEQVRKMCFLTVFHYGVGYPVDKYSQLEHVICFILRVVYSVPEGLMALLRELGTAYLHLSQFNCRKAIDCLNNLPPQQFNTGWVLSLLGKAYYELTEYQQAVR